MTASKRYTWKTGMALMILAIWIGIDGLAAIAGAQVQPPRRKRRVMVSPKKQPKDEERQAKVSVGKSLLGIARRASRQGKEKMVDFVFVIERGEGMTAAIAEIKEQLDNVVSVFEESGVDYQIAPIWFENQGSPNFEGGAFRNGLRAIQAGFYAQFRGGESNGYGLEAMMWGVRELDYRSDAGKHMIVVTRSPLQTAWEVPNAKQQLVNQIIERCRQDKIHVNVIGLNEAVQLQLPEETGGKWYAIDEYQQVRRTPSYLDKRIQTIGGIFERIGEHMVAAVKPSADIVFVFDSSFSMKADVDDICGGLDVLADTLDEGGLDYHFGVIRFWARAGGGESSIVVTKPPLDAKQVKKLFRLPKEGDEHLLDAIIEGVPKLQTPEDRQLVLIIVTDEPTSQRREKGYTPEMAIGVCRQAGAVVYVVGGYEHPSHSERDVFQRRAPEITKGEHYAMPNAQFADERW